MDGRTYTYTGGLRPSLPWESRAAWMKFFPDGYSDKQSDKESLSSCSSSRRGKYRACSRRVTWSLIGTSFVLLLLAVSSVPLILFFVEKDNYKYYKAEAVLTLHGTYNSSLGNLSDPLSLEFQNGFCQVMERTQDGRYRDTYTGCLVTDIRNGSIIVEFTMFYQSKETVTSDNVKSEITAFIDKHSTEISISTTFNVTVDTNSLTVKTLIIGESSYKSEIQDSRFTTSTLRSTTAVTPTSILTTTEVTTVESTTSDLPVTTIVQTTTGTTGPPTVTTNGQDTTTTTSPTTSYAEYTTTDGSSSTTTADTTLSTTTDPPQTTATTTMTTVPSTTTNEDTTLSTTKQSVTTTEQQTSTTADTTLSTTTDPPETATTATTTTTNVPSTTTNEDTTLSTTTQSATTTEQQTSTTQDTTLSTTTESPLTTTTTTFSSTTTYTEETTSASLQTTTTEDTTISTTTQSSTTTEQQSTTTEDTTLSTTTDTPSATTKEQQTTTVVLTTPTAKPVATAVVAMDPKYGEIGKLESQTCRVDIPSGEWISVHLYLKQNGSWEEIARIRKNENETSFTNSSLFTPSFAVNGSHIDAINMFNLTSFPSSMCSSRQYSFNCSAVLTDGNIFSALADFNIIEPLIQPTITLHGTLLNQTTNATIIGIDATCNTTRDISEDFTQSIVMEIRNETGIKYTYPEVQSYNVSTGNCGEFVFLHWREVFEYTPDFNGSLLTCYRETAAGRITSENQTLIFT